MGKLGKPVTQRQLRVGEMIKQALGTLFIRDEAKIGNFSTKEITVTYGATPEGKIALNKLNEQIAKERGVSVAELTVADDSEATEKKETKKSDAKKSKK